MVTLSALNNATPRAVNAVSSITSNAFSPPPNSLIAVCLACTNGAVAATSLTDSLGSHLTYTRLATETANGADAEIWLALCPSAQTNMTVTATFPSSQNLSIFILVLQNANTTQATNATSSTTSASGTPSGTVTTTAAASYVFSVVANVTNTTAPTVAPGQFYSWNGVTQETNDGTHSAWVQTAVGQSNSGQAVTVSDTAPAAIAYAMVTAEILSIASPAQLVGSFPASNLSVLPAHPYLTQKLAPQSLNAFPVPSTGRIPGIV